MALIVGYTYEIETVAGRKWVAKITGETSEIYHLVVLEDEGQKVEYSGRLYKSSPLLKTGTFKVIDGKPVRERKQRRTSDEVEVDKLIEHVQRKIKLDELWELIDCALQANNYEVFLELSKEYAKLKKKVTA